MNPQPSKISPSKLPSYRQINNKEHDLRHHHAYVCWETLPRVVRSLRITRGKPLFNEFSFHLQHTHKGLARTIVRVISITTVEPSTLP